MNLDPDNALLAHLTSGFYGQSTVSMTRILDGLQGFVNHFLGYLGASPPRYSRCGIFTTITHVMHSFSRGFPLRDQGARYLRHTQLGLSR